MRERQQNDEHVSSRQERAELIGPGEAAGTYREYNVGGSAYATVKFH
jgi:hypothetical protein